MSGWSGSRKEWLQDRFRGPDSLRDCWPRSTIRVVEDNAAYPKAQFDLLEAIPVLPAGMDEGQQINIQCQVLEVGEIATGDRARKSVRVTDEMGEETDGAGALASQSGFGFGGTGVGIVDGMALGCNVVWL